MIEKLNKHFLRNDKVEGYFKENIEWKSFSLELLKRIYFNDGNFFTLLPNSARLERVYILESGILPPNPRIGNYEPVSTLDAELSEFIQNFLTNSENKLAIVENAMAEKRDKRLEVDNTSIHFIGDKEVYYILSPRTPFENILWAVSRSREVWHFLAVLTEDFN